MPLTDDKSISTAKYWDDLYSGARNDAPVDASNTKRVSTFDRFQWVADIVEGPSVLEACAGHARIAERVRAMHPDWHVYAADQSEEARNVSRFRPYAICSVYDMPVAPKSIDTVIVTQAFEYIEEPDRAMAEIKQIGKCLVCTVPIGEMAAWSQLRIYKSLDFIKWLSQYGEVTHMAREGQLLLTKTVFND